MTDTIRSQADLITASADNSAGNYTNQNQRDFIVSVENIKPQTITAAGTDQGSATALSEHMNVVTVCSSGQGVRATGIFHEVFNASSNPVLFYPQSGANFPGLSANVAITIPVGDCVRMTMTDSTHAYLTAPLLATIAALIAAGSNYANDAAAAAGGIAVGHPYLNTSFLMVRRT